MWRRPIVGRTALPAPCVAWVNPAAYALPDVGAFGDVGVGSLRGPAFWQWDQAVSRQFQIGRTQQIEIRVEAFNVTDSLRLGNPITSMSDARFGTDRIQQWRSEGDADCGQVQFLDA